MLTFNKMRRFQIICIVVFSSLRLEIESDLGVVSRLELVGLGLGLGLGFGFGFG